VSKVKQPSFAALNGPAVLWRWPCERDRALALSGRDDQCHLSRAAPRPRRGHAAGIIDGIFKFKEREPATEKQLRYMHFLGHPNPFAVAMTKREAGRWIQARKSQLEVAHA